MSVVRSIPYPVLTRVRAVGFPGAFRLSEPDAMQPGTLAGRLACFKPSGSLFQLRLIEENIHVQNRSPLIRHQAQSFGKMVPAVSAIVKHILIHLSSERKPWGKSDPSQAACPV